ncbi:MAG: RHS repeat-associated core domain-containing protein [Saprospirales bacterium]|nr:RHS repeat-associated core domain-containing protein [Saprospirales bacterium]
MHYNLLNLPDSITDQTNNIWLDYTFGGQKIRKELSGGEERFYLGGLEVVDGEFEAFYHPEGRAVWRNDTLRFQYKLTDHLGNTVVFFEDKDLNTEILTEEMTGDTLLLEVLQRNYYYPFGMEMEGLWDSQTGPGMRYLYNGKEWNEDLGLDWYDYGARWYDPSIGRWNGVDPLASDYAAWSPYNYVLDNPIRIVDPDGQAPKDIIILGSAAYQQQVCNMLWDLAN